MGSRRDGREAAVQFLYNRDLNSDLGEDDFDVFFKLRNARKNVQTFAAELARGVLKHREEIDVLISKTVQNFELERLSAVDRNVIRLAVYEMFHCEDVPPIVSINEAIEISKRFGTDESGSFVNGVLDKLKEQLTRPLR
jgi:N utilization substance protein B